MQRLPAAVVLLLGGILVLAGCTTRPQAHKLGLLMRDGATLEAHILERDVQVMHCPAIESGSGDIGEAVEQAISSVPGATVLLDVRISTNVESSRSPLAAPPQCIVVTGHAARLD